MTRDIVRRQPTVSRPRGLALAASAVVVLGLLGRQLALLSQTAWLAVLRPGPAALDPTVTALSASLALVLVGWLLAAVAISLVATLLSSSSRAGAAAARCARLVAPTVLRNAVAALLGAAVLGSSLPAGATGLPTSAAPVSVNPADHRPVAGLSPDWPVASPAVKTPAVGDSAVGSFGVPGRPGPAGTAEGAAPLDDRRPDLTPNPYLERSTADPADSPRPSALPSAFDGSTTDRSHSDRFSSDRSGSVRTSSVRTDLRPGWVPGRPVPARTSVPRQVMPGRPAPVGSAGRRDRAVVDDEIVVRRGDTLWSLAARHLGPGATDGEIASEWPHWFTANRQVIGADPDRLLPGERLHPPSLDADSHSARNTGGTIR